MTPSSSHWRSPSELRPELLPRRRLDQPAPPAPAGWPRRRSSSSAWCASRTSATSTSSFTDKTGTLTDGHIGFERAIDPVGADSQQVLTLGLVCNEATMNGRTAVGGNPLDVAMWESPASASIPIDQYHRMDIAPFDHNRLCVSVLIDHLGDRQLITKGAPETILDRCIDVTEQARLVLDGEFRAGNRVVAIAARSATELTAITPSDEHDPRLAGFLVFLGSAQDFRGRVDRATRGVLGITVKIVTGDNAVVAETVCRTLGVPSTGTRNWRRPRHPRGRATWRRGRPRLDLRPGQPRAESPDPPRPTCRRLRRCVPRGRRERRPRPPSR